MIDKQKTYSINAFFLKAAMLILMLFVSNQLFAESVSDIPVRYFSQHGDMCDSCVKNQTSIRYLQIVLNNDSQLNLSPKLVEDGLWGKKTKAAVVSFQFKYLSSPEANGEVRLKTKAKLDVVLARIKSTPVTKPFPPEQVDASDGAFLTKVEIFWQDTVNTTSYNLYRCTNKYSRTSCSRVYSDSKAHYIDSNIEYGKYYYYRVKSCNQGGCSDFSTDSDNKGEEGFSKRVVPAIPEPIIASDGTYSSKVRISWQDTIITNFYELYRCPTEHKTSCNSVYNTYQIYRGSTAKWDDNSADLDTTYYYRVKACNRIIGCSELSGYDEGFRTRSADVGSYGEFLENDILQFNLKQKAMLSVYADVVAFDAQILMNQYLANSKERLLTYERVQAFRDKLGDTVDFIDGITVLNKNLDSKLKYIVDQADDTFISSIPDPDVKKFLQEFKAAFNNGIGCRAGSKIACAEATAQASDLFHRTVTTSSIVENSKKMNSVLIALASVRNSLRDGTKLNLSTASIDDEIDKISALSLDIIDTADITNFWNIFSRDHDKQKTRDYIVLFQNTLFNHDYTQVTVTTPPNHRPHKPQLNIVGGLTDVSLVPNFRASIFNDPDSSDSHSKTWWGIREYGKRNYIFDSGWSTSNKYSIAISGSVGLQKGIKYQAVVAFMDNHGTYSIARFVTFTTKADTNPNNKPNTPSVEVNGGVNDVSLTPVLTTSSFSDLDANDSHDATWWEIRKTGNVIWNSSWDKTNLTSITIPTGILDLETTYTVYVRHRDSRSAISGLGSVTFTTKSAIGADNKPDLAVLNVAVSNISPIVGESIQLEADIKNIGSATATSTHTRYYVSTDSNISTSDTEVDSETTFSLDAGETDSERETFSAPATSGTYWVGMCVDVVSNESNTSNNCSVGVRITVTENTTGNKPDWVLINPSVSKANLQTGERIRFTVMLKNQGTSKADNSQIKFYISHDSIIGTDDELKRSEQSTSLDPGEQDPLENKGMDAPDTTGTYWVGACIDAVSNESNTTNNCSSGVRIVVTGSTYSDDFSFERVSVDKTIVEASGSLALYAKEEYNGTRTANRVENTIAYLLKSQNDSSIPEVYLADDIGVPSNGSTSGKRETVTIPINTKPGLYFIVFIADYPNEYVETNENNNTAQVAIEVVENTSVSFNLDIDGDGEVKPLTDGLLNLRYQFGFRGDTLINGAVAAGATRNTVDQIETYLIEGGLALDIDGNGEIKPLTDGLLTLRYLFGFRDDTLINNSVDGNATRKTKDAVETYLGTLIP